MAEKQYLILLDVDTRKRHHHKSEGGKIIQFMVQLEVRVGISPLTFADDDINDNWPTYREKFLRGDFP
jgi:hypothetical protein